MSLGSLSDVNSSLQPSFLSIALFLDDLETEFNLGTHVVGKRHNARKVQILGNKNNGRPGSQFAGNKMMNQMWVATVLLDQAATCPMEVDPEA